MIDYYNYDTSPRKLEPEYEREVKPKKKKTKKNTKHLEKNTAQEVKKNFTRIVYIAAGFAVLLTISYRYAIINTSFNEKENLKSQLAELQKQNQQLTVNIEQGMNINKIEQEAKERLGMQKLDNNQKVYVNLNKSDYVESNTNIEDETNVETWWSKLLKDLLNIK